MSSFTESNLVKKFTELNNTQQSIQTLSLWLIHHKKHSRTIVQIWYRELEKAKPSKRLTFVYLANDVIQNSKRKGPEFSKDFAHILPDAFTQASKEADDKMKASLIRVITIWKERGVYDKSFIKKLKQCVGMGAPLLTSTSATSVTQPISKSTVKPTKQPEVATKLEPKKLKKNEPEYSLRQEVEAMGVQLPQNVDAEDLVQRLSDLENSASCDASVRERIAALPPEVSDISHLDKIQDRESADRLSEKVDEAALLLNEYNRRLVAELEERKKVARMLRSFILSQQQQVKEKEKSLQEFKDKLHKVTSVRQELVSHIQNLPDLTLLPDVTGGLAPLPSAGDLFSLQNL
ncbi:regulation of nuclear pre-mRNA domain-containing protein 1B-like isoform X1 [Biomphalaria pfeifferi]|uniref:Regulation of nuclear pre-mRNA domain-containing protein 1B-like isoform X1 n=1 Tax=Biomphalaria pfeifferi TaxID=112525 RepID=A0AAD8BV74_BIOPF|nr:regulation of nuclear pre-mRNA domain-containing protein 1B-like isoform X1 [Biomphalaria pfeifferi]